MQNNNIIKALTTTMLAGGFLLAIGCNSGSANKETEPVTAAKDSNDAKLSGDSTKKDADRVVDFASAGLYEITLAKEASKQSTNISVQKLAKEMVAAHDSISAQLKDLAAKKNITLPETLTTDQLSDIKKITDKKGTDFDKAFLDELKDKHEKAISKAEDDLRDTQDADFREWLTETLPKFRAHLEMINIVKTAVDKK